jgi:hypothetical protein
LPAPHIWVISETGKVIKVIKVISRRGCHGKVIKVITDTLIILGDHLWRLAKSARGQKFSLILGVKFRIVCGWNSRCEHQRKSSEPPRGYPVASGEKAFWTRNVAE